MKTISVNFPAAGEGVMLEVQGLGVFENGTTTEIDEERVEVFRANGGEWPEDQDQLVVAPSEPEEPVEEEPPVVEEPNPAPAEEPSTEE